MLSVNAAERTKIAEGKTKSIWTVPGLPYCVDVISKDDLTAGDGAKRDEILGKGSIANQTACNCFHLLRKHGIPTHFVEQISSVAFRARKVRMVPIEFVARRIATGSYLKRNLSAVEGQVFRSLVLEMFFKDDARHDPYMLWDPERNEFQLYNPKLPLTAAPIGFLDPKGTSLPKDRQTIDKMMELLTRVFLLLESAWGEADVTLVDLKIEMGYDEGTGQVLVADVIDNDAWRIWPGGDKVQMKDKQVYRNLSETTPEALNAIRRNYEWVAEVTSKFI